MNNYRRVGVRAECCGICKFNQFSADSCHDVCIKNSTDELDEAYVCDLFEIQEDSIRLCDVQVGDVLEYDTDEPYRGNAIAGPFDVVEVDLNGFSYPARQGYKTFNVHKFAPLRGYKKVKDL